jgi:hypothetical protein
MTDKNRERPLTDHALQTEYRTFCRAWLSHLTPEQQRRLLLFYQNSIAQNDSVQHNHERSLSHPSPPTQLQIRHRAE